MDELRLRAMAAAAARRREQQAEAAPYTPPEPPEGFFYNPHTGQMTNREMLSNHMQQNAYANTTGTGAALAGAGRGASLGAIDEISGAVNATIPGPGTARERYEFGREFVRAGEDASRQASPSNFVLGEIGGAVSLPLGAVASGGTRAAQIGRGAAAGAGFGAIYGNNTSEGNLRERLPDALTGGALGAGVGAAIPAAMGGAQALLNRAAGNRAIRRAARSAPTTEQLRRQAADAYRQVDDAGVQIRPEAFERLRGDIQGSLTQAGADLRPGNSTTPGARRVMEVSGMMADEMAGAAPQNPALPFSSLDQLRRQAGNVAASTQPMTGRATPDARLGSIAIEKIDDFVQGLGLDDVATGDVRALQTAIPKARELYAKMSRSGLVDDAIENSENYLSGQASGIRNQFRRIASNPKLRRGFSEAELTAIKRVAQGTIPEQLVYGMSGILGNLGMIGLGTLGGPVGTLAATAGAAGMRKAAGSLASRNAEIARALVASGGLRGGLPVARNIRNPVAEALTRRAGVTATQ